LLQLCLELKYFLSISKKEKLQKAET